MTRRPALSLSVLLLATGGVSVAQGYHTEAFELQFGNLTAVEPGDTTFSVDVRVAVRADYVEIAPTSPDLWVLGYQVDVALEGLELRSIDALQDPPWVTQHVGSTVTGLDLSSTNYVLPVPWVGLFRMDLELTGSGGPRSITLDEIVLVNGLGDHFTTHQETYALTIPAPATLALLAGGLGGFRRRRAG